MAAFFFKEGNLWVCKEDNTLEEQVLTSGNYVLEIENGTTLSLYGDNTYTNLALSETEVTNIHKDRIGTAYTDVADFITTNEEFFQN